MIENLTDELLYEIFGKLPFKSMICFKLTCKRFGQIVSQINASEYLMKKFVPYNHLTALLELLPYAGWDWAYISDNPNISINFVLDHPALPWNYRFLSGNSTVTMNTIKAYPEIPWNYRSLSENPNLKLEDILNDMYKNWESECITHHKWVTWEIIQSYPEIPWYIEGFSFNPNITPEIIENNPNISWNFGEISYVIKDIKYVEKNLDKKWDFQFLSENPYLTWEKVKSSPGIPWNFDYLSEHPCVTWEIIQQNPNLPWEWEFISKNPNINIDIVEANLDKNWFYDCLLENSSVYLGLDGDNGLLKLIEELENEEIDYNSLSYNRQLTWKFIMCNLDKNWNYKILSENTFDKNPFSI